MNAEPWIDVSVLLKTGMVHWPGDPEFSSSLAQSIERGDPCNVTQFSTSAHIGTHMDAPRHFIADGPGIEALPLDATIGPARVVEISDPRSIQVYELEDKALLPGERILFKTRNSAGAWNSDQFVKEFVYISKEAAAFLVEKKVRTVGVDYLSIGGFYKDAIETHRTLLGAGVWVIEGLNLAAVGAGRYELLCLPIKLEGADGAPARVVLRKF